MGENDFGEIYKNVFHDNKERLAEFRASHQYKQLTRNGVVWEYFSCGRGEDTLVLLPGGLGFNEALFLLITALENKFHIISPTYPPVKTMTTLAEGIAAILELEDIRKTNLMGVSFGGWLAQCFVRHYPEQVSRLILSNTSGPDGFSTTTVKIGVFSARYFPLSLLKSANKKRIMKLISPPDSERGFWEAFLNEKYSYHITREDMLSRMQNTLDYMSNYTFSSNDLAGWRGQILILESSDDLAFEKSTRESLKLLYPSAQVVTLRNAGHAPSHRGSPEYISAIIQFLL